MKKLTWRVTIRYGTHDRESMDFRTYGAAKAFARCHRRIGWTAKIRPVR